MATPNPLPTEVSRDTIAEVRKDVIYANRDSADDDAIIRVKDPLSNSPDKLEQQTLGDVIDHYPDGGWRAWSVVFVSQADRPRAVID